MNKIKLSLLSFGILFGSVVFAQETKQLSQQKLSNEQNMEKRADNFGRDLDLSAEQREKIADIRKRTNEERQNLKNDLRTDNSNRGTAMQNLRLKEREEISKVLTPEQALKFDAMKENRRTNHQKRDHKYQNQNSQNKKFKGERQVRKNHHKSLKQQNQIAPEKE